MVRELVEQRVPRVGRITASDTFRLVAAMNSFDNVGTTRVSVSVYDRLCRLAVGYQSRDEEREIVALSESRRTESNWIRIKVRDGVSRELVAEMILNGATLKSSYAKYDEEAKALGKQ